MSNDPAPGTRAALPAQPLPVKADILIVGGGINGTAIAREAALRGLQVALIERHDLAVGASAWNSRMIHGGIRYLEHAEFRLVYESLHERERLLRTAPHLVKPYPLMIPFYRHNNRPAWMLNLGMTLYDLLSMGKSTPNRRILSLDKLRSQWPGITPDGLVGGGVYYDTQVQWAERLCVENALAAKAAGATIHTHVSALRVLHSGGAVTGVLVRDEMTGQESEIRADVVINAAGANIDGIPGIGGGQPLIGGTKGTHVLVEPFEGAPKTAVHYEAVSDGRAVLVLPWNGKYLIGATDIFVEGDPALARTDTEEIDYLLEETNRLIPSAGLSRESVVFRSVGVRPLPRASKPGSSANVSRDHVIHDHAPQTAGLWSIIGGKLTTHRSLAEQTLGKILKYLHVRSGTRRSVTRVLPLPGGNTSDWAKFRAGYQADSTFPSEHIDRLLDIYGTRVTVLEQLAAVRPELRTEVTPGVLGAEIANAFEEEFARSISDVLLRRTMTGLGRADYGDHGRAVAEASAKLGYLSTDDAERQVQEYVAEARHLLPPGPETFARQ